MAEFEVKIYKLTIEDHSNADALELAMIGNYRAIVMKDAYQTGDLAAYIPEGSIVPDWLIARLGLEGRLAGKQKNRVKAIKLRGVLSQGLIVPLEGYAYPGFPDACTHAIVGEGDASMGVCEGDDVTEFLGVTKYEPVIPTAMNGEVFNAFRYTLKYDIENIKKFPTVLQDGEDVAITEKIHGTWTCFGSHPEIGVVITSKGLSAQGLAFKMNEANDHNLYIRTLRATGDENILDVAVEKFSLGKGIYLLGETFGRGVQDLAYGFDTPSFRLFDVYVGTPGEGRYLDHDDLRDVADAIGVDTVPILYRGPYSEEIVDKFTNGRETVSGTETNIREGIVIRPTTERRDIELGRVLLKSVSEKYLLRKNATEFN